MSSSPVSSYSVNRDHLTAGTGIVGRPSRHKHCWRAAGREGTAAVGWVGVLCSFPSKPTGCPSAAGACLCAPWPQWGAPPCRASRPCPWLEPPLALWIAFVVSPGDIALLRAFNLMTCVVLFFLLTSWPVQYICWFFLAFPFFVFPCRPDIWKGRRWIIV